MLDKEELCEKIRTLYSDIGECGIHVDVDCDEEQKAWVVYQDKGHHRSKTLLEEGDAERCMLGQQCVSLGIEIAQLRTNIERIPRTADRRGQR